MPGDTYTDIITFVSSHSGFSKFFSIMVKGISMSKQYLSPLARLNWRTLVAIYSVRAEYTPIALEPLLRFWYS